MDNKVSWLTPPPLHNSSCTRHLPTSSVTLWTVTQCLLVLLLSAAILGSNLLAIFVLNSRRFTKYIHAQPRYLLTSLASNDLAIGLFVTPFGVLPAVYHCWPYGEIFCQIQSLLRGALRQQSAVILICMAIDRYMCTLYPNRYHRHSSKKGCVAVISLTWAASVTLFASLVLPRGGYYFNGTGLLACDPFFPRASLRILAACLFYFPTTMMLMYCYGSVFHASKLRLKRVVCSAAQNRELPPPPPCAVDKLMAHELRMNANATRSMAAMSLGFIVLVTPWTLQEVVAACTGTKAPPFLDFLVTWLAMSHSFWSPFLFWLLDSHFRRVCRTLLVSKFGCRRRNKAPCPNSPRDLDCLSEQRWGEILERAVSSSSLQALQRLYSSPMPPDVPPPPPRIVSDANIHI